MRKKKGNVVTRIRDALAKGPLTTRQVTKAFGLAGGEARRILRTMTGVQHRLVEDADGSVVWRWSLAPKPRSNDSYGGTA
jgi:hypothetical protein